MKWFICGCFLTFMMIANGSFSQAPDIFAVVDGNNLTLWETAAYRNCGALYLMNADLDDHHIDWYQVDTGLAALCYCTFDLSVTYGPLEPGDYSANVYFTESYTGDTIFEGTTTFSIGNIKQEITSGVISQYQSDCYTDIKDLERENGDFVIYPVPAHYGGLLYIETYPKGGQATLEIVALTGIRVYCKQYNGNQPIKDQLRVDELFPVTGIYLVRLITVDQIYLKKISVL